MNENEIGFEHFSFCSILELCSYREGLILYYVKISVVVFYMVLHCLEVIIFVIIRRLDFSIQRVDCDYCQLLRVNWPIIVGIDRDLNLILLKID